MQENGGALKMHRLPNAHLRNVLKKGNKMGEQIPKKRKQEVIKQEAGQKGINVNITPISTFYEIEIDGSTIDAEINMNAKTVTIGEKGTYSFNEIVVIYQLITNSFAKPNNNNEQD